MLSELPAVAVIVVQVVLELRVEELGRGRFWTAAAIFGEQAVGVAGVVLAIEMVGTS